MKEIDLTKLRLFIKSELDCSQLSKEEKEKASELNRLYVIAKKDKSVQTEMMFTGVAKLLSKNYKDLLEYYMNLNFLSVINEVLETGGKCFRAEDEMRGTEWYYFQYEEDGEVTRYTVRYDLLDPYFDDDECCQEPFPDFAEEYF